MTAGGGRSRGTSWSGSLSDISDGALSLAHPGAFRLLSRDGANPLPGLNLTIIAAPAGLSIIGNHILATLREEVFEA